MSWNYPDLIVAAGLPRQQRGFGLGLNLPELQCHLSVKASVSRVFAMDQGLVNTNPHSRACLVP